MTRQGPLDPEEETRKYRRTSKKRHRRAPSDRDDEAQGTSSDLEEETLEAPSDPEGKILEAPSDSEEEIREVLLDQGCSRADGVGRTGRTRASKAHYQWQSSTKYCHGARGVGGCTQAWKEQHHKVLRRRTRKATDRVRRYAMAGAR